MRLDIRHPYVLATLWAVALIASSALGRGSPFGDWVDAALYVGFGAWLAMAVSRRGGRSRR